MEELSLASAAVATAGAILIAYVTYWFVHFKVVARIKRYPPGPMPLPIIGNLLLLGENHLQRTLYQLSLQYGPLMSIWFGTKRIVIASTIESANEFLVTKGKEFAGRPQTKTTRAVNPTPGGLVSAEYSQEWRDNRKNIHRLISYNRSNADFLKNPIEEETANIIMLLQKSVGDEINLWDVMFLFTTNVIGRIFYSKRTEIGSDTFKRLADDFKLANILIRKPLWKRIYQKIIPSTNKNPLIDIGRMLYEQTNSQIEEHRRTWQEDVVRDWMDTMVAKGDRFRTPPIDQACPIVTDAYLAAVDSTKNSLLWSFLYIGLFPAIQRKLHAEIDTREDDTSESITGDEQDTLPYLEAFIHEVLRHSCVSSFGQPHKAMADSSLGGYFIPVGQLVMFNTYAIHYDVRYWDNPEEFRPERFINEKGKFYLPNASFIPFSNGIRSCIGDSLAKLEMFVVLSNLLKNFTFSLPDGHDRSMEGQRELSWAPPSYKVVLNKRP